MEEKCFVQSIKESIFWCVLYDSRGGCSKDPFCMHILKLNQMLLYSTTPSNDVLPETILPWSLCHNQTRQNNLLNVNVNVPN